MIHVSSFGQRGESGEGDFVSQGVYGDPIKGVRWTKIGNHAKEAKLTKV